MGLLGYSMLNGVHWASDLPGGIVGYMAKLRCATADPRQRTPYYWLSYSLPRPQPWFERPNETLLTHVGWAVHGHVSATWQL
jgi:hypothetical protein